MLDRVVIDQASDEWQAGDITSWKERKTESVCVYKRVFVEKVIGREHEGVGDTYALYDPTSDRHSASGEHHCNLACYLRVPRQYHIVVHHCNEHTREGSTASITAN